MRGGGRIGTFVEYLVLINLTLNKRNNNNGKTASNAVLLETLISGKPQVQGGAYREVGSIENLR